MQQNNALSATVTFYLATCIVLYTSYRWTQWRCQAVKTGRSLQVSITCVQGRPVVIHCVLLANKITGSLYKCHSLSKGDSCLQGVSFLAGRLSSCALAYRAATATGCSRWTTFGTSDYSQTAAGNVFQIAQGAIKAIRCDNNPSPADQ